MRLDLHVHSTASDGAMSATELVSTAMSRDLVALSITDHDSVDAIPEALSAARETNLLVIPGVELSTLHEGRDVHILGYFVDPHDPALLSVLATLRDARRVRARTIVSGLREAGFELTIEEVLLLAEDGSVGRSHVARALVDRGHVPNVADAFSRFIGRGAPFYVAKPVKEPAEVVQTIISAGGVPVLAHPGVTEIDDALPDLIDAGLQGLEAYHAEHTPEMRQRYAALAAELDLLVTGGSDFHGPHAPGTALGSVELPEHVLPDLLERAGRRDRFIS